MMPMESKTSKDLEHPGHENTSGDKTIASPTTETLQNTDTTNVGDNHLVNKLGLILNKGDIIAVPKCPGNYYVCRVERVLTTRKEIDVLYMMFGRDRVVKIPKYGKSTQKIDIDLAVYKFAGSNVTGDEDTMIKALCSKFYGE